jgi:hypothetical protein
MNKRNNSQIDPRIIAVVLFFIITCLVACVVSSAFAPDRPRVSRTFDGQQVQGSVSLSDVSRSEKVGMGSMPIDSRGDWEEVGRNQSSGWFGGDIAKIVTDAPTLIMPSFLPDTSGSCMMPEDDGFIEELLCE